MHWVDDHPALFANLMRTLAPGGTLAVQMPRNHHRPLQKILGDFVDARGLTAKLQDSAGRRSILTPEE